MLPSSEGRTVATNGKTFPRRVALDGIRGVMAMLVVAFHLRMPWASQGYVGVDVFFVLSGFVISSLLIREQYFHESQSIHYARFYARRCKRLLPASLLVLISTAVLFRLVSSERYFTSLNGSFLSAALFSENFYLIYQSADYFAVEVEASPVMHYWSLAVEEQYYFLFPLFFGQLMKWTRFGLHSVYALLGMIGLLLFYQWASLEEGSESLLYFSTLFRLYQLLAGVLLGVLAFLRGDLLSQDFPLRSAWAYLGFGGLLFVATPLVPMHSTVAGWVATVCTLLMIGGLEGDQSSPLSRALCSEVAQFFGRHSYAIYLWHYPVIMLMRLLDVPLTPGPEVLGPLLLIVALSWVTWKLVELPIKQATLSHRKTILVALLAVLGTVIVLTALHPAHTPQLVTTVSTQIGRIRPTRVTPPAGEHLTQAQYFLLGDSYAWEWTDALPLIAEAYDVPMQIWEVGGCPWWVPVKSTYAPDKCVAVKPWMELIHRYPAPRVLFFVSFSIYNQLPLDEEGKNIPQTDPRWVPRVESALCEVLDMVHAEPGNHVVILEPHKPCLPLYQCRKRFSDAKCNETLFTPTYEGTEWELVHHNMQAIYARVADERPWLSFISIDHILAPEGVVSVLDSLGQPTFRDQHHLELRWLRDHAEQLATVLAPHIHEYPQVSSNHSLPLLPA